ncbi:MAG: dihydrofolate reductase [Rhodospirillaceae bacterium]|nr:dihydrofolate reductase [Rhodospirillaceae bacterium]MBT3931344.1 dihydrofolate reductase [Rhodospirillaceae bacterium]MBT5358510.1 dihydrofolate reductase [Rhodospirillaceae bacterium]MBT5767772.1 dihydrofolate reductase [Rhodospirillaceae bacterium]MBT7364582.1 dihydrofolate reductase [Rhodospirillaceae bacterium]
MTISPSTGTGSTRISRRRSRSEVVRISLIVAVAENGVIGRDGDLPWRIPADLKFFKETTTGHPIVMGRKTHQSIGRALPGRKNIVITRDPDFAGEDIAVVGDLEAALAAAGDADEVMVIGGAQIYELALPRAHRIYLTEVHVAADGETRFPDLDRASWRETARVDHPADGDTPAFSFVTLER